MDYDEYRILDKRACVLKRLPLDTNEFLDRAYEQGILDELFVDKVKLKVSEKDDTELDRIKVFIFELTKYMSFEDFITVLEMMGHLAFATGLRRTKYGGTECQCIYQVKNQTQDYSPLLLKLFVGMKRIVDNKEQPDLPGYFKGLGYRIYVEISKCENVRQRDIMANQLGVLTWLQTQLHTDLNERKKILKDLHTRLVEYTTDTSLINTVFHCKMACTAVLSGDFDLAIAYISQAEIYAEQCKWPFARTIVHHDRQFINRKQNVKRSDPANVKEIIKSCERGLDSLVDIQGENQILLKRIFLLNMVQALLGIGTFLEIDPRQKIQKPNLERAQHLLKEVENLSKVHELEKRRNMILLLSKGRLAELTNSENEATDLVAQAEELSACGAVLSDLERKNIHEYRQRINN